MSQLLDYHFHGRSTQNVRYAFNVFEFERRKEDHNLNEVFRHAIENLKFATETVTPAIFIAFTDKAARQLERIWVRGNRGNGEPHFLGAKAKAIRQFNHQLFDIVRAKARINDAKMKELQEVIAVTVAEYRKMPQAKSRIARGQGKSEDEE